MYAILLLVAATIVGARILTAPPTYLSNDQSRWSTIRALVETGSYSIGYREESGDGKYRDFGIVTLPGWNTNDVVLRSDTLRFYSSKPTLLPTVLAAEYWIIRNVLGLNLRSSRSVVSRMILLTINLMPFVFYLLLFARLVERLGTTDWGRLLVFTTVCFGTFVSGFLGTLNNHTVAAVGVLFALYHCLCIHLDGDRRPSRFLLVGFFAGWTMCNELPAAVFAAALMLWLMRLSVPDTLRFALPSLLLPVAVYLFTQYVAMGTILPTYAREEWYQYAGSYWRNPSGIDRADDAKLLYAFNLLLGHTGILSLTPVLLLGWIGMLRSTVRGQSVVTHVELFRVLNLLTLTLTLVTFTFYVLKTSNYGGLTSGPRWFFWLVPLWLLTMLPEADRWALDRRWRRIATVLLVISIATASYALEHPWRASGLFLGLQWLGIISYS